MSILLCENDTSVLITNGSTKWVIVAVSIQSVVVVHGNTSLFTLVIARDVVLVNAYVLSVFRYLFSVTSISECKGLQCICVRSANMSS